MITQTKKTLERIDACLAVLAHSPPMTPVEMNRHFVRCSEEMARAEARRDCFATYQAKIVF